MTSSQPRLPQPNSQEPSYCLDHLSECSGVFSAIWGPALSSVDFPWRRLIHLIGATLHYAL